MTTEDLRRIDELVHSADMAVRVASQLRLWIKRNQLGDPNSLKESLRFLDEALSGGRFVATGDVASASSSLSPLTWSADIRFGFAQPSMPSPEKKQYEELVDFLGSIRETIDNVLSNTHPQAESVESAARFFSQLGKLLGGKADSALRSPAGGTQMLQDRFSYQ